MGAAVHADDLHTISSIDSTVSQANIIKCFTIDSCLKLNASKFEFVISTPPETVQINDVSVDTSSSAECLGVWWQHDLSGKRSVKKNINKARRALGSLGAFQGDLNPLSSSSFHESFPLYIYKAVKSGFWTLAASKPWNLFSVKLGVACYTCQSYT